MKKKMKMTKYIIVLALTLVSSMGYAQTTYTDVDTKLKFTLNKTNATITGSANGSGLSGTLVIPAQVWTDASHTTGGKVIAIDQIAFQNYTAITSLDMSGATYLTTIGVLAFKGCTALAGALNIPGTITSIGSGAFQNCSKLTGALNIPNSVTSIGDNTFNTCSGFTTLSLPNGLTSLGQYAFNNCSGLTGSLAIPAGVTSIGMYAFRGCAGFNGTLTLPDGLTTLGNNAFDGCKGFTGALVIPSALTKIGAYVFQNCSGLNGTLTLPAGLTSIGQYAFNGCKGLTGELNIPSNVTSIERNAFAGCAGLNGALTLPPGLTVINDFTFNGCSGLTGMLNIPSGVTAIKQSAFSSCGSLSGTLTLPAGLTSIDTRAFYNCSKLIGALTIPDNVTSLGSYAFNNCYGFNGALTLSGNLTTISDYTFNACKGLTGSLVIPDGVTSIATHAFDGCTGFNGRLTLSDNLVTIGDFALQNCSSLNGWLNIPDGVTSIGQSAFKGCKGFTGDLTLPQYISAIGSQAFGTCAGFRSVTFNSNTLNMASPSMGYGLFSQCTGLEFIDMSNCNLGTAPASLSRTTSTAVATLTPFGNTAARTLIYLPQDNGTLAGLLNTLGSPANSNYVLNASDNPATGTCPNLAILSGVDYYLPYGFTAGNAGWYSSSATGNTYSSALTVNGAGYKTIYMPFPFTSGDMYNVYELSYKNNHGAGLEDDTFVFTQLEQGSICEANTPYVIIYKPEAGDTQNQVTVLSGSVEVPPTPVSRITYAEDGVTSTYSSSLTAVDNPKCSITINDPVAGRWGFYGTTEAISQGLKTSANWNAWVLSNNLWAYSAGAVAVNPLKAFIVGIGTQSGAKPNARFVDIGDGETTTSIDSIDSEQVTVNCSIYNISGKYVGKDLNALPKGLYIVNGKKVIKN